MLEPEFETYTQLDRIKNVLDQYASLENILDSHSGLEFIVNCYLVSVGFRPLFYSDNYGKVTVFSENLLQQAMELFPELTFSRAEFKNVYVHHPLLKLDHKNQKELGALLNFIDFIDLNNLPENQVLVSFSCGYKQVLFNFPLTGYILRGSTQVSQVANKVFQMRMLLRSLNVRVSAEIGPK